MALYSYSWLILFSPLFSFVVIVFGTRMWDLLSRKSVEATATHEEKEEAEEESDIHEMKVQGPKGEDQTFLDIEDPKVPRLTPGARISAYLGIVIMGLACIYSWILLLASTGVIPGFPMPAGGVPVFSYNWFTQGTASYIIAFRVDNLAIAMMVVVTTVSLLVQFYSQGYMERSSGYARFFAYLSLFTFSMLDITFAQNFLVIFIGWELVGLSSYLLIGFWINKRAKPDEDRPQPATAAMQAFIVNRIGDVGFIIGIMILFWKTGTYNFAALSGTGPQSVQAHFAGNST